MKQKVLVSIDTEGPAGTLPVERMIYGQAKDGNEYGIRYIMKLLDANDIRGLFFVDIPEIVDHGEDKIERVLRDIDEGGHDIGVHVHPDHMADSNRWFLWQYTRAEQYEIIARCTDFYEKVLKRQPLSFRAGRYGANNDTLSVLDELGYLYDMSEFQYSRYCKIEPEVTWNRIVKCGEKQLKEVPVTTFRSLSTPFYSRNDQIDSGNMPSEFKKNMDLIIRTQAVDVISFFMHSFQFLNWRKDPDAPTLNNKMHRIVLKNLETIRELVNQEKAEFIVEQDLRDIKENEHDRWGALDASKGIMPYLYFAQRAYVTILARLVRNV